MSASPFALGASPSTLRALPLLLSIDSATDRPTLAIGEPPHFLAERIIPHRHDLSRDIDGVARALIDAHGGAQALGGVLVADGPGSFTGLRIGIAFAKGVAGALNIPLLTAPSMMGAAANAGREMREAGREDSRPAPRAPIVVDYDALRGDVYRAVYHFTTGEVRTIEPPRVVAASTATDGGWLRATADQASAAALLGLVGLRGGAEQVSDPGAWQPSYGRLAEAEARRLARHGD